MHYNVAISRQWVKLLIHFYRPGKLISLGIRLGAELGCSCGPGLGLKPRGNVDLSTKRPEALVLHSFVLNIIHKGCTNYLQLRYVRIVCEAACFLILC